MIEATEREEIAAPGTDTESDEAMQNREPLAAIEPLPVEKVTNLVTLATNVAHQVAELANPPPPEGFSSVSDTIDTLLGRGVLDPSTALALQRVIDIAQEAARGVSCPRGSRQPWRTQGLRSWSSSQSCGLRRRHNLKTMSLTHCRRKHPLDGR